MSDGNPYSTPQNSHPQPGAVECLDEDDVISVWRCLPVVVTSICVSGGLLAVFPAGLILGPGVFVIGFGFAVLPAIATTFIACVAMSIVRPNGMPRWHAVFIGVFCGGISGLCSSLIFARDGGWPFIVAATVAGAIGGTLGGSLTARSR